jgi:hypothetical protein
MSQPFVNSQNQPLGTGVVPNYVPMSFPTAGSPAPGVPFDPAGLVSYTHMPDGSWADAQVSLSDHAFGGAGQPGVVSGYRPMSLAEVEAAVLALPGNEAPPPLPEPPAQAATQAATASSEPGSSEEVDLSDPNRPLTEDEQAFLLAYAQQLALDDMMFQQQMMMMQQRAMMAQRQAMAARNNSSNVEVAWVKPVDIKPVESFDDGGDYGDYE